MGGMHRAAGQAARRERATAAADNLNIGTGCEVWDRLLGGGLDAFGCLPVAYWMLSAACRWLGCFRLLAGGLLDAWGTARSALRLARKHSTLRHRTLHHFPLCCIIKQNQ